MKKVRLSIVAIIIIGVGAYFLLKPYRSAAPTSGQETVTSEPTMSPQSLQALVAAGSPVTCTFATSTEQGSMQGTVYIANGMIAGDFTADEGGPSGPVQSHMLVRDTISYLWTSLSSTGYKSTVDTSGSAKQTNGVDYNAKMDYRCSAWTVDSNKFTLPTNVSFTSTASYTAPPQGAGATGAAPAGMPKGTAAQCAQCNGLPSAQKAQCVAALQC